ncbi:MAG: hypothetical protein HY360_07470 [Verrucomicrobia bacterium]|nr:hypothetical protein [Verrucomicrobiota bacterium]
MNFIEFQRVTNAIDGLQDLPLSGDVRSGFRLAFRAPPGLCQFSVIADARECNWDELYVNLHLFGNKGQRTGPWDFNLLDGNIFLELALLNRDYWGGSILQDHGRRALIAFAAAAVHLIGIIPEAHRWLSYAMHYVQRSTQVMSRRLAVTVSIATPFPPCYTNPTSRLPARSWISS